MDLFFGKGMDVQRHVDRSSYSSTEMPEFPARVLLQHIVVKGAQFGGMGAFLVAPIWAFSRARPLSVVFPRVLITGATTGVAVSLGLLAARGFQGVLTVEGVDDRAFRLSKNQGQKEMDTASALGALTGATMGSIFGQRALRSVVTGSLVGMAAASAGFMAQRQLGSSDEASVPAKAAAAAPRMA